MSAEPCKVCGALRKVDIIHSSDGWHQPECFNCGDPAYIEVPEQVVEELLKEFPLEPKLKRMREL